jgi:peptidylprolyl isomerase
MSKARLGDVVEIRCTTRRLGGTVIEAAEDIESVKAELGAGDLPEPLEETLTGMRPGERTTARLDPIIERRDELVHCIPVGDLPHGVTPRVGEKLAVCYADGKTRQAAITDIADSLATLDSNHPLAGCELIFDIELVSVSSAPP